MGRDRIDDDTSIRIDPHRCAVAVGRSVAIAIARLDNIYTHVTTIAVVRRRLRQQTHAWGA